MKTKDKEFIREILSSDFKPISNPNFTHDTLGKISELEDVKISYSYSGDMFFVIPVIMYVTFIILLSLISALISWLQLEQVEAVLHLVEMIWSYLLHPVTFSILFSFSILYLLDLFLKKQGSKNTKLGTI